MNNFQSNLKSLKDIHTRTELWKDKIYYISPENYLQWNFPTNQGQKGFLPKPIRFNEIITEFKQAIEEQKEAEVPEEDRQVAQERIKEIISDLKEIIQGEIDDEENSAIEFEPGAEENEADQKLIQDWEKVKKERIKNLKFGLKKQTVSQFRKFNREFLENEEVEGLLEEWEEEKKVVNDRKNVGFVLQDTQDSFQFCYQPPKGNFPALADFLWYRNNIWYETTNWIRLNHENALITAKRSYFIHNYLKFIQGGANGVLHNYPVVPNQNEICQCPNFLEGTNWLDFFCDWQPTYSLWQLKDMQSGLYSGHLGNLKSPQAAPVVHTLKMKKIDPGSFDRNLKQQMLFLLPINYNGSVFYREGPIKINFESRNIGKKLKEWAEQVKVKRGMEGEHLLRHCVVQFYWNSKLIYTACLDDLDLDNMEILIRANPSDIMYLFQSRKVFFRWSEDVQFTIDRDIVKEIALDTASEGVQGAIQGAVSGGTTGSMAGPVGAVAGAVSGLVGGLFNMSKGQKKTLAGSVEQNLHNQIQTTESKAQDEGQTERKTKFTGTASVASAAVGCIPSILNPSHTKNDYTIAEFALRFNQLNFQMRVEYNQNSFDRYFATKKLKKNCNRVITTEKLGNILRKGFIKMIPITFERDPHGYFASILSQGTYIYDEHPHEYYLERIENIQHNNASLRQDASATITTIEENYSSAIGRDDLVHVDDMSWVWKDSYCRPAGGGTDLFPQLINGMRHNIKRDDANAWKFDGYSSGQSEATLTRGVQYEWFMHAFSSGQRDSRAFRGLDDGVKVILKQDGADWELAFQGRVEITETIGNPDNIGSGLGGTENEPETLPEIEDERQTEGLGENEQVGEPEPEQENQNDREIQEELEQQQEQEPEPEQQKEEELEQEDDQHKEKQRDKDKQKQKEKQQEQEDEQQPEAEYSGEQEK